MNVVNVIGDDLLNRDPTPHEPSQGGCGDPACIRHDIDFRQSVIKIKFAFRVIDLEKGIYKGYMIQIKRDCGGIPFFSSLLYFCFRS